MEDNILRLHNKAVGVGLLLLALLAVVRWQFSEPLKKYGIHYTRTSGESRSFQTIHLYRHRDNQEITGPEITGDNLRVTYEHGDGGMAPEILVSNKYNHLDYVRIQVNVGDRANPDFKILGGNLAIDYPPAGRHWP